VLTCRKKWQTVSGGGKCAIIVYSVFKNHGKVFSKLDKKCISQFMIGIVSCS